MNIMTSARMTEADYERERVKIPATKRDARNEGGVRWEQQLAMLFYRSGWTNEQLAVKEGLSRPYISQLTVFGRFLHLFAAANNAETLPKNLAEYRFREYRKRTARARAEKSRRGRAGLPSHRRQRGPAYHDCTYCTIAGAMRAISPIAMGQSCPFNRE